MAGTKWQFSIATLMLFALLVAVSASHYRASLDLRAEREEIKSLNWENDGLRAAYGVAKVEDKSRTHVANVTTSRFNRWRWAVYLPETCEYRACFSQDRPQDGNAPRRATVIPGRIASCDADTLGQTQIELEIYRIEGKWYFNYHIGATDHYQSIAPELNALVAGEIRRREKIIPRDATVSYATGERIMLLSLEADSADAESAGLSRGLSLWLEPYDPLSSVSDSAVKP